MISAELGTTYQSEGGMYDWVKRAFGAKWAARVAWNYWINFPLWIASLAVAVTDVIAGIFDIELSIIWLLVLQLGYTWLVSLLGTQRIGESKWIVNICTFFKIAFMVLLGLLGIYVYVKTGESANPITSVADLLPTFDLAGLSFLSVIIFNFLGFEVVATFAEDMENPKKEIPQALIIGGTLMALFYVLPATGINIAMSVDGTLPRQEGDRLAASYVNYYTGNGFIALPVFGDPNDQKAIDLLQSLYPDRVIEPIYAREILLGGGNIHCITQQVPENSI